MHKSWKLQKHLGTIVYVHYHLYRYIKDTPIVDTPLLDTPCARKILSFTLPLKIPIYATGGNGVPWHANS